MAQTCEDVPMTNTATTQSRKLAFHLERGDHVRYERRTYRVGHVGTAVAIPSRTSGRTTRTLTVLVLWDNRGNSRRVNFEQDAVLTLAAGR